MAEKLLVVMGVLAMGFVLGTLLEGCAEAETGPIRHSVQLASGRISYLEQGKGPVALFVHGVLLNGYLWRHQLADLSDLRRCIAVDLLAHGDTEISPGYTGRISDCECHDAQAISRRLEHRSGGSRRQ